MPKANGPCLVCGTWIEQSPGKGRPKRFCSLTCKRRWRRTYCLDDVALVHGRVCYLCGDLVDDGDASVDHVVPIAAGGSNELANLRVVHMRCNRVKGAYLHCPHCGERFSAA